MLINQESILDAFPLIEDMFGPLEYSNSCLKSGKNCLDIRPVNASICDDGFKISWVMSFTDSKMAIQSIVNDVPVELIEAKFDTDVYIPIRHSFNGSPKKQHLLANLVGAMFADSFTLSTNTEEYN